MQEIQQAEEEIQTEWEQASTAMAHMVDAALIWTDKYDQDRLEMQEYCAGWTMGSAEHSKAETELHSQNSVVENRNQRVQNSASAMAQTARQRPDGDCR